MAPAMVDVVVFATARKPGNARARLTIAWVQPTQFILQ